MQKALLRGSSVDLQFFGVDCNGLLMLLFFLYMIEVLYVFAAADLYYL